MIYRIYTFINFYLNSISQGIQSAHVQQELVNKYSPDFGGGYKKMLGDWSHLHTVSEAEKAAPGYLETLVEWATNHKTMITLNGGIASTLKEHREFFIRYSEFMSQQVGIALPWAKFHEDEQSLDGTMTAVAIVLPEIIYDAVPYKTAMNRVADAKAFTEAYPLNDREGSWFFLGWRGDDHNAVAHHYPAGSPVALFLDWMKQCPLAR